MTTEIEYKEGSTAHARDLATVMEDSNDGITIGLTDTAISARALRAYAGRWRRRAALAAAVALLALLAIGAPDVNGDARASLADLGVAVRLVVGA